MQTNAHRTVLLNPGFVILQTEFAPLSKCLALAWPSSQLTVESLDCESDDDVV